MQGKTLVIEALKAPRQNWFTGFKPEQTNDEVWGDMPTDEGDDEWTG